MIYCAQPMVVTEQDGWTCSRQVPTFYLHSNVQGILTVDQAEKVVRHICNPTEDPKITVHPNVTEIGETF